MRQHEINKRKKIKQKRRESAKSTDMEGPWTKRRRKGKGRNKKWTQSAQNVRGTWGSTPERNC